MKKLVCHPLFICGLLLRLMLLLTVLPYAATQWYVPFMSLTVQHFTLNPWHVFLAGGGLSIAFPYGYVMWLAFLPLTLLCSLLGIKLYFAYGLTLLLVDVALLFTLKALFQVKDNLLLFIYWLSPITLFATYWLGFNDLIPVTFLTLALYCLRQHKPFVAGLCCGAAMSAKLSMLLAIPFLVMYLWRNNGLRIFLARYVAGLVTTGIIFCLPFLFSVDGVRMLFNNPEMGKAYQLILHVGGQAQIYLLPMAYLLALYLAWRIRRISFNLLNVLLGIAFFLVVLLTPASPGWFIWVLPLLVMYQAIAGRLAIGLVGVFTVLYVFSNFFVAPYPLLLGSNGVSLFAARLLDVLGERGVIVCHTLLFTLGIILLIRIWRETIRTSDYFRLSRKSFIIGIAGDSGAGKDTLSCALEGLFGCQSTVQLSGDDYHFWDRHKPMWQVMTHLNPRANDLERFTRDLLALANGKTIRARHYDHVTGKMTRPRCIVSNDFIVASGLHALYLPMLRNCYDLSIYLDIDEDLRRYFKVQRDVSQRGHSEEKVLASLRSRFIDAQKFVHPQAMHADLIMSLQPIHAGMLTADKVRSPLRFKLSVRSRHGLYEELLVRVLVGVCGLHVDMTMAEDNSEVALVIEGETTGDDIALAARILFPEMQEFLAVTPYWQDGVQGLMQLVTLSHINQALNKRLI